MSPTVFSVPTLPNDGQKRGWSGAHTLSAKALAIATTANTQEAPILVIAGTNEEAEALYHSICFFIKDPSQVLQMPDRETLPYDSFSPHQDIVSQRLRTLHGLSQQHRGVLVVSSATLMQRLPPVDYIQSNTLRLYVGETFDGVKFADQLIQGGYHRTETVLEHGEFALRGSVFDVFPMGSKVPYRVDLFDDEIESIKSFDTETQRSTDNFEKVELLPAGEVSLQKRHIRQFKDTWYEKFHQKPKDCPIYVDIADGLAPPGIEYYLPMFFEETASLFDYLNNDCVVIRTENWLNQAEKYWSETEVRFEEQGIDPRRPLLPPTDVFISVDTLHARMKTARKVDFTADAEAKHTDALAFDLLPDVSVNPNNEQPWQALQRYLSSVNQRVLMVAESNGRREALVEQLQKLKLETTLVEGWHDFTEQKASLAVTTSDISHGLALPESKLAVITEDQLFGQRIRQTRARRKEKDNADQVIRSLAELNPGAPVVHIDHGIGRYLGLETLVIDDNATEFLLLQYANEAKLYVPVSSLHLISRYTGSDPDTAPLHKLGTDQWQKAREKAAKQVQDTAAQLLSLYAKRESQEGYAYEVEAKEFAQFSAQFPFEETIDQQNAIDAVAQDMQSKQPMDRLVCGDVGFGKTEVAMRAAFIAAASGKQVAILVPTTLLAQQHYESFKDRFADTGISIEVLSRFVSDKEQTAISERIKNGQVDITVGTHRLLSKKLPFKDLGLVIIDEEHRFGVKHKDALKALRANVDILTMTATPIPRTLNMAMSGMRDLSIIATPPAKRLSVKTFVRQHDSAAIKEAILRELLRGGQVFFLHNEVKTIEKVARELQELVEEARVVVAHGQMRERELEQVMGDFYHKRFNVLVCTTIVETGIDIPSANTIIIDRADKFGLAQLHQLRGRVGRSHHQAYAFLLTPHPKAMTADATKRLEAISEATDLGAGFTLATHDLEIRGAGELLGDEQTGHISAVGYTLFMEMLNNAVEAIKRGEDIDITKPKAAATEVNLNIAALIPDDYLPDINTRLTLYKRISDASDARALDELKVEMIDRFGLLPEQVNNLFTTTLLRQKAESIGISKLVANASGGKLEFSANTSVEPLTLIKLVQSNPSVYQVKEGNKLHFSTQMVSTESRIEGAFAIMNALG